VALAGELGDEAEEADPGLSGGSEIEFDQAEPIADESVGNADPDLKEGLHAAISALPDIYRATFVMHDIEGYTHTEIAAATGVAVGTSKGRLFIARGQLRKMLAPFKKE
jgi:RNA polymerase sigma-70 factor (ECF subfamily)